MEKVVGQVLKDDVCKFCDGCGSSLRTEGTNDKEHSSTCSFQFGYYSDGRDQQSFNFHFCQYCAEKAIKVLNKEFPETVKVVEEAEKEQEHFYGGH